MIWHVENIYLIPAIWYNIDKFFKETFENITVAKDFINNYLSENIINIIHINTLEAQKDSFINEELKEEFSDLLLRININKTRIYITITI